MASNRIGLNMVTIQDGNNAEKLLENLNRIRQAGFQSVGLWVSTIQGWLDAGNLLSDLASELKERVLRVDELCFVGVLDDKGKVADQTRVFEWASELRAPAVISIYGKPDAPLAKVRSDWAEFVSKIEDTGVEAAFEFIGPWPQYNSPLQAWEVIKEGPEAGTMVFDTYHFWRGGCDLTQIGKFPGNRVSLIHLNDVKNVKRETSNDADRTYPGEGVIPLKQILTGLVKNGFTGPLSVEIFGEVQKLPPDEVCKRACEATKKLLKSL